MKLKYLLVFSLFILIFSLGVISASDNITDDISQTQEAPVISANVSGSTFEDIQKAIDSAKDNDEIILNGTYTGSGAEIKINKAITIKSATKSTLDAKSKSRIFNIASDNVILINLNLINGKSTDGGAIYASKNLTIVNCDFKDNKAFNKVVTYFGDDDDIKGYENTAHGGAINTNASLTCINSTFTGNYPKDPSVKYQELKFENYGLGGAIFSCIYELEQDEESSWWQEYPAGPLNLINCTFNENYDSIFCSGRLTITNSLFNKNIGLTISAGDDLTILNSNFTKNYGYDSYDESEEEFYSDSDDDHLILASDNALISDCQFIDNSKYHWGTVYAMDNATIKNSCFINNTAQNGGALYVADSVISNSKFINNHAYYPVADCDLMEGGAVFYLGKLTVEDSLFKDNTALYGAAIFSEDTNEYDNLTLNIINSNFTNNIEGSIIVPGTVNIDSNGVRKTYKDNCIVLNDSFDEFKLIDVKFPSEFVKYYKENYIVKLSFADTKKPLSGLSVYITAYKNGKKVKTFYKRSDENGISVFNKLTTLPLGSYEIKIYSGEMDSLFEYTSKLTIKKVQTKVKASKLKARYKKTKYFKVTVKDKKTKKAIKKLYLKIKVFNGKKYKIYTIKTNSNGVAKLNTKKLKYGSHKVLITSKDTGYKLSAKSKIIVK